MVGVELAILVEVVDVVVKVGKKYREEQRVLIFCQGTWHWGDYPVRPRGNPQPIGVLLSIYFNAY